MRLALWQLVMGGFLVAPLALSGQQSSAIFYRGRRWLLGSAYILPKDAEEAVRLDAQHALMGLVLGGLTLAPLTAPRAILDVGCGTGIWAQEMARRYPDAAVLGIDLDMQGLYAPPGRQAPLPNVSWQQTNALDHLPLLSDIFDLVHLRFAATWIPLGRWLDVLVELVRVIRPGGYVELVEGSIPDSLSSAYTRLGKTVEALLRQRGLMTQPEKLLACLLRKAGLNEVTERHFVTGKTAEQQRLLGETTRQGFRSLLPLLHRQLAPEAYAAYQADLAEVEQELPPVTRHDLVVWGRKPEQLSNGGKAILAAAL